MAKSFNDCLRCGCNPKEIRKYINTLSSKVNNAPTPDLKREMSQQISDLKDCLENSITINVSKSKPKAKSGSLFWPVMLALIVAIVSWSSLFYGLNRDTEDKPWHVKVTPFAGALLFGILTFIMAKLFL